jgi:hypothetical protein
VIVLITVLASGCAAGGYRAASLHDRLVRAGVPPAEATCVINAMVDKFGHDQLNARVAPIAAELRAERELRRKCHAKVRG